tara:strand:+ start:313 stop:852 length:540 start_codon:yes stop_codon:yes gene_type:complete
MKKILFLLLLNLFYSNLSLSEIQTFECREEHVFYGGSENFETLKDKEYVFLDFGEKSTLIVEHEYREGQMTRTGKATFVYDNFKREFTIGEIQLRDKKIFKFDAYKYTKVTKEEAKEYKEYKNHVGKFHQVSYLDFFSNNFDNTLFELYFVRNRGVFALDIDKHNTLKKTIVIKFACIG